VVNAWISLLVFVAAYTLFVVLPNRRSITACAGGMLLVVTGVIGWKTALYEKIDWNVMGLFFGTLVLAELFMLSRVPAVMAEWLVDKARSARGAMLALCALAGAVSMCVENVAVVLLIAPVALSLAARLKTSPVPLLIGIAICSNLQGTSTMIGDPPSMILAGYMQMGFWDFFVYKGKAGIFFAVQIGAICSMGLLAWVFRGHREGAVLLTQETARSWVPTVLLGLLVVGLSFATAIDPEFEWFSGAYTLGLSLIALVWFRWFAKWGRLREFGKTLDWDTTFFLIGVFVLVGGLSESGWMDKLSDVFAATVGNSPALAFAAIVLFAVLVSGVVDNVPFLLVMIPVVQTVADKIQTPVPFLMFGLLIGACLGGNLTPIGASANVVTIGILKKQGYTVSFREFMRIGIPFTVLAVVPACIFVWLIWG